MNTPLVLNNVRKSFATGFLNFKKSRIIKGISFKLKQGEIFGLLGPNGVGKTTTLKMITGLIFPDAGEIKIFGNPVTQYKSRLKMGFLPENPNFYEYLSAREFLETIAYSFGFSKKERKLRTEDLLNKLGIIDKADIPLRKYSKGMLQRAGLAQTLIGNPDLIILDEPLSGLDPIGRKDIREIILELKKQNKTILLSSHILADMEEMCDRVGILIDGKIGEIGTIDDMLETGVKSYEIDVTDTDEKVLNKLSSEDITIAKTLFGHRITIESDVHLQEILKTLIKKQVKIKEVKKHRYSLEDLFIKTTKTSKKVNNTEKIKSE